MKYTKEERLEIGRRIYAGELNRFEAGIEYGIAADTARSYMRAYRAKYNLCPKNHIKTEKNNADSKTE